MSRASKRDTKPEEKAEVKAVPADTTPAEVKAVPADTTPAEVKADEAPTASAATAPDAVVIEGNTVLVTAAPDPDTDGDGAAQPEPALPDHLAHRVSLEEYGRLRGLSTFGKAHLTRAAGTYDRPFEEWEAARQNVIGG